MEFNFTTDQHFFRGFFQVLFPNLFPSLFSELFSGPLFQAIGTIGAGAAGISITAVFSNSSPIVNLIVNLLPFCS